MQKKESRKPRMLVIAKTPPLHDRASGDYRLFQILRTLAPEMEIDFLSTHHVLRNLEEKVNKTFIYFAMRDGNFNRRRFEFVEEKYFNDLRAIGARGARWLGPIAMKLIERIITQEMLLAHQP
jgi:hypothetical protein